MKSPGSGEEEETEETLNDEVVGRAVRFSIVLIMALAAVVAAAVYLNRPPRDVAPVTPGLTALPATRRLPPVQIPQLPFADITVTAGIDFVHENGADGEKLLPETMGGGGAFLDFDNDGDQDIFCVNSNVWPWSARQPTNAPQSTLYANDGSGRFTDVTSGSGLETPIYGNGVACGDYDNDGRVDLFVTAVGANRLYHNEGGGRFTDVTLATGVAGPSDAWSTSAGWFDYDLDGDLDLFVCNYIEWSREKDRSMEFTLDGTLRAYGRPTDFTGVFPILYRNEGNGTFLDVSAETGVQVRNPDTGTPLSKSLGLTFADVNSDGRPDIVIANDTVQNLLVLSQPDGTFTENATGAGVAFDNSGNARGAMGIDAACFRNSDAVGIVIGNFANEMTALYVSQTPGASLPVFRDEAVSNGIGPVTRVELTFGVLFVDIDLDGRLDLFAANGHLEQDIQKVQASQHYEQPPQLLWNCGSQHDSEFMVVTRDQTTPDLLQPMVGRGATLADIDGDGDSDLLILSSGGRPRLLRNDQQTGHHWLRLRLQGTACNRDAIGARIEVTLPDQVVLSRTVNPTRSYQSQVELPVTFGLGQHNRVSRVRVVWPGGSEQDVVVDQVDQLVEVQQKPQEPV